MVEDGLENNRAYVQRRRDIASAAECTMEKQKAVREEERDEETKKGVTEQTGLLAWRGKQKVRRVSVVVVNSSLGSVITLTRHQTSNRVQL
jgi:hypothetical protein